MGCRESKHAVAIANTITRKKSSVGKQSQKSEDTETIVEKVTNDKELTNTLLARQQEADDQNLENNNNYNNDVVGGNPFDDVKDIAENPEVIKEGDNNNYNELVAGRLISKESPNRYFSSRKEEESVEGIVSEVKSEDSDYDSPRPEAGKESLLSVNEEVEDSVQDKKLAEPETVAETKNEGLSEKKDENLVKETEKETAPSIIKTEVPAAPAKEHAVASPTNDLKTV